MKKISIRERLILYFVVLSVLSIATVSLFSIFEAKKGIINRTFSQMILLRDLRKEQILTFFESRKNELRSLALSDGMIELASEAENNERKSPPARFMVKDQHLLDLVTDTISCRALIFVSAMGNSYRFSSVDQAFYPENGPAGADTGLIYSFRTNLGNSLPVVHEQVGKQGALTIFIAAPVLIHADYLGTLFTEMKPEALYSILYSMNPGTGLGKTGEVYMVGLDGLMRSPSRFVPGAVLKVPVTTEGFTEAAGGIEGVGIYNDYRGTSVLGAYGRLEFGTAGRVILAEIDSSEALVPLKAIRNEILLLSLFIVLAIFAAAWFVAYGITRPLVRLKNAANFIALGHYNQQLEVNVNDEIGELTRAFNVMAKEIESTTRERKENEERLRHFYRATLDGIILHDSGRMVLFNSAMLNLTGYTREELQGFRVSDILQVRTEADCDKNTETRTFESLLIRSDGSGLPVEVQESYMDFEGKNIKASVIRDISARKKMEAELAAERNNRLRAVIDGQDTERQRLSRELHDGLGQQLVAGKLILESSLYGDDVELKPRIGEAQRIFDQIIGDIRRISHDLSPSILQEFGLLVAMENLCNNIIKSTGIDLSFSFDLHDQVPDEMTSTYLFRIAQEGLNNVQRHSGATSVRVTIKSDKHGILMEIEDNGCGFQAREAAKKGGTGLYNMRERANILKGNLLIKSSPGHGTKLLVRVPFISREPDIEKL
jgi:PAS domain S-box-containing protein